MAQNEGFVTVYESSDGGTGDPAQTKWQFFVNGQPVSTTNQFLADTMRLAIDTNRQVRVTYDPADGNKLSQARLEFEYGVVRRPEPYRESATG